MSFSEKIKLLAEKAKKTIGNLTTEEATKNALVMPFLSTLGYDVFDPDEVVPEFTADIGTKKGEKVDYAIVRDGKVIILIEAKKAGLELATEHANQLYRYFSVTSARIGILTNGHQFHFYSDLDEPNKMDSTPFLKIDLLNIQESVISEVEKLSRSSFDLENMLLTATDLKHINGIQSLFERQIHSPDEDFVRFFFSRTNPNARFTQNAKDQFSTLVKDTISRLISDRVDERLRAALEHGKPPSQSRQVISQTDEDTSTKDESGIITTEEELEGYRIIRAIVCSIVSAARISYRDSKTYFSIIVDNNNRRTICRLHFNRSQKYIGLFDAEKKEVRHAIEQLEDIYNHSDQLRDSARKFAAESMTEEADPVTA